MHFDTYEHLLKYTYDYGYNDQDRTGTGVRKTYSASLEYSLINQYPLITTRKIHFPSVVHELLWLLKGDTNIKYLNDNGVTIWDEWADENGELGPIYGKQWRKWTSPWGNIDQLKNVILGIKENPHSRRHILSSWNVFDIPSMALAPCHVMCQFMVLKDHLRCHVYQRSADLFLGVPYNIASYALLTYMVAKECDLQPWVLNWTGGDCHIYNNHLEQTEELLRRPPRAFPKLALSDRPAHIFGYKAEDITLTGYDPYPAIKAEVAV